MADKETGILQEHIQKKLDDRHEPLQSEKLVFNILIVLGVILFLVTLLVPLVMLLSEYYFP